MKFLIHHFLENNFNSLTKQVAIIQGKREFTYGEIDQLGWQFAAHFKAQGLKKGDHIGLLSYVRAEAVGAMLGALRCGIVYIPFNIYAPAKWMAKLIHSAAIKHLVFDFDFYDKALVAIGECQQFATILCEKDDIKAPICFGSRNLAIDPEILTPDLHRDIYCLTDVFCYSANRAKIDIQTQILADDIAYILYTSGSTGQPKGIMITHRNAFTFIEWMRIEFKVGQKDRVLSQAPLQFDLSVFDIYTTLTAGGCLIIPPLKSHSTFYNLITFMREEQITIVYTVPSAYIAWLTKGELKRGISTLRLLLYAGEPFPPSYLKRVMECLPNTVVSNIYGPTETNIVTHYTLERMPTNDDPIPIGRPVFDTEVYIVDEKLQLVPEGEMGEIVIRGGTVFSGYFNDPELTKAKLIQSPFHKHTTMIYRTGDYGCQRSDGTFTYHGRIDSMVKTRGYRVEISEVENAISCFSGINEVAIISKPHEKYGSTLHAFIVLDKNRDDLDALKLHLKSQIPSYMIPFEFIQVPHLPKTSTGKIDRYSLKKLYSNVSPE